MDYDVLATVLKDPKAPAVFKEHIIDGAVGKVNHSYGIYQLYKNAIKCYEAVGEVNFDTFGKWLQQYPDLYEKIGGKKSYDELVAQLDSIEPSDPVTLSKLVNHSYNRTIALNKLESLKEKLASDQSTDDDIDEATIQLQEKIRGVKKREKICIRTALDIAKDSDDLFSTEPFIPTQYKSLNKSLGYDKNLGGMMRGNIYSIVATSGRGKSSLAKSMCNHWLDQGEKILFINFEESKQHWERILMTQVTGHNVYKSSNKTSDQLAKISNEFRKKMEEWGTRFMVRHDPDSLYFEDLEGWLRDLYDHQEEDRPDIVVIDTIQSLFTKSGGKARWGEFEQIMVRLEKLAKDMDAVFILTAQQNSNSLRESRNEINQSDIAGGVTIVQKSSVVMVLMPMQTEIDLDSYGSDGITPIMEVHIIKNRIAGLQSNNNPPLVIFDDECKLYLDYDISKSLEAPSSKKNVLQSYASIDPTLGI
jgi:replicative DNA helicase